MEIKKWKDFPKEGITFIDINNILQDADEYAKVTHKMSANIAQKKPLNSIIISPESRGHLFASVVARNLHLPLIQFRKEGKYPADESIAIPYITEYGEGFIYSPIYDYTKVEKVFVVDDLLATGQSYAGIRNFIKEQNPNTEVFYVTAVDLAYLHEQIAEHYAPLVIESPDQIEYIER